MTPVSLLLVDDHAPTRHAMRRFLEAQGGFNIVAEAEHGAVAVRLSAALKPEIVLMDAEMPVMNGFEATRQIVAHDPNAVVVMVSALDEAERMARDAGARAFVGKRSLPKGLVAALQSVRATA